MYRKGQTLHASTRKIIYNVIQFAMREKEAQQEIIDFSKALERVAAMTGLCRVTISKIKKEGMTNEGVWFTPGEHRRRRSKKFSLDNIDKCAIRNKIDEFYTVRKEVPTLRKLWKVLQEDMKFTGSIETLRMVLNEMGFKFNKCQSRKLIVTHVETLS